ncbi:unnamed protein product, partial [Iphiclides podalirius]
MFCVCLKLAAGRTRAAGSRALARGLTHYPGFVATETRACARHPIDRNPATSFRQHHGAQILTGLIERQTR